MGQEDRENIRVTFYSGSITRIRKQRLGGELLMKLFPATRLTSVPGQTEAGPVQGQGPCNLSLGRGGRSISPCFRALCVLPEHFPPLARADGPRLSSLFPRRTCQPSLEEGTPEAVTSPELGTAPPSEQEALGLPSTPRAVSPCRTPHTPGTRGRRRSEHP